MQTTEQTLVSFFEQVAKKDKHQLSKLRNESCFSVDNANWHFTLPTLYSYLQLQEEEFNNIDYKQFRRILFNSTINQTVKLHGAEIIITDNQAKVDLTGYALSWKIE